MESLRGFYRPVTVEEAARLLAQDPDARLIAGGATLVAMINARVVEPTALVSLAGIAELRGITTLEDGRIRIGAFTRHRETAAAEGFLRGTASAVRLAATQIANATIRNMGTIGGSVAFSDPGLDYPPALVAAGASIELASPNGRRSLSARDFFVDWYTTALEPQELVTAVVLPASESAGAGVYVKHARVAGDYATVSVAACLAADGGLSVAVGGCGPAPLYDAEANRLLGSDRSDAAVAEAGRLLEQAADPLDDVRGSAQYRRLLIPRLLLRAVRMVDAAARADQH
jgi:carbon-monoxide dehydrogenase medium subunit